MQLGCELQQPRPAVGALERSARGPRQIGELAADRGVREVTIEERNDIGARLQRSKTTKESHERPVHVHARMPVVAAVERRMQGARRARILVARDYVVELVRVV